jgi:hypothetical protein
VGGRWRLLRKSALALFMARVFADDTDDACAADDAAELAEGFDGGTDSHGRFPEGEWIKTLLREQGAGCLPRKEVHAS